MRPGRLRGDREDVPVRGGVQSSLEDLRGQCYRPAERDADRRRGKAAPPMCVAYALHTHTHAHGVPILILNTRIQSIFSFYDDNGIIKIKIIIKMRILMIIKYDSSNNNI